MRTAREIGTILDLRELTPTESLRLEAVTNTEVSPCGDDVTLAESFFNTKHCPLALLAGRFIVEQVKEDYNEEEISQAYLKRYAKLKGNEISEEGSPRAGAEHPLVTFVVFTDFQCPFCSKAAEKLDEVLRRYPQEVAVVFKNFPLVELHPESELAARAAFAAKRQDKFWQMHDTIFSAFGSPLDRERIVQMAAGLGLDVEKFEEDISSPAATAAIETDIKLGKQLGVRATPTIFINGRLIESGFTAIDERLDEERMRAGLMGGSAAPAKR
jgi:protein-disulfide isomerase